MNPQDVQGWIQVAQILTALGLSVADKIKGWIADAHPSADPAEIQKAYDALMADALVRENIAKMEAGEA